MKKIIEDLKTVLLLLVMIFGFSPSVLAADKIINIQGKLTNKDGKPITGVNHVLHFRLYDKLDAPVTSALWQEDQGLDLDLHKDGLFNVQLGNKAVLDSLAFDQQLYLGIAIDAETIELGPRQTLSASPYALGSIGDFNVGKKLNVAGGIRLYNDLLFSGDGTIQIANGTQALRFFMNSVEKMRLEQNGNVGIGTASPQGKLDVVGGYTFLGGLRINGLDASTNEIWNANESLGITVNKTGGGQTGIYLEAGTGNVGIGTAGPGAKLDVMAVARTGIYHPTGKVLYVTGDFGTGQTGDGGIEFRHSNATQGVGFGYNTIYQTGINANQDLNIRAIGTGPITLNAVGGATGNVGIGTASPREKLEVNGNIIANGLNIGSSKTLKLKYYQTGGLGAGTHELGIRGTPVTFKWDPGGQGGDGEGTWVKLIVGDYGTQLQRDGLGDNLSGGILCEVSGNKAFVDFIEIWYLALE